MSQPKSKYVRNRTYEPKDLACTVGSKGKKQKGDSQKREKGHVVSETTYDRPFISGKANALALKFVQEGMYL